MGKPFLFLFIFSICISSKSLFAQKDNSKRDTFFLAKKKGLLGRIGKSIASSPEAEPVKIANPYLKFNGKIIRDITIFPLTINQRFDDTSYRDLKYFERIGDALHKTTRPNVIKKNLFFSSGDKFLPLLVSDNERFLRDQVFLQDARIIVLEGTDDSVDIAVFTRDIFSIGGSVNVRSTSNVRSELREENIFGTGNTVKVNGLIDLDRSPAAGIGGELVLRNIGGTFLNSVSGFKTFSNSFSSNRFEENTYYSRLEKPLVTRYSQWTGAFEFSLNKTANAYSSDSLYAADFKYSYSSLDLWAGYNFGYKNAKGRDSEKRLRHLLAGRSFYNYFYQLPLKYDTLYDARFANLNGILFSYTLYRQNFYRTSFIYGFGRYEDLPVGLSASIIAGWTNKENLRRPYYGIEFEGTHFAGKSFNAYRLRAGGYRSGGDFEDVNLLMGIDHITRLKKLRPKWYSRKFVSFSYTKQVNPKLNEPLFLNNDFGLPYFANGDIHAEERTTLKLEFVYYNLTRILGFRFAPFMFGEASLLKPVKMTFPKSDLFSAFGAGIRARNENLVFGTIELRGFYFPRINEGMKNWKVDVTSKLRIKYNSNFIKKPAFINAN